MLVNHVFCVQVRAHERSWLKKLRLRSRSLNKFCVFCSFAFTFSDSVICAFISQIHWVVSKNTTDFLNICLFQAELSLILTQFFGLNAYLRVYANSVGQSISDL